MEKKMEAIIRFGVQGLGFKVGMKEFTRKWKLHTIMGYLIGYIAITLRTHSFIFCQ